MVIAVGIIICFGLVFEIGFHYVAQAGLKLSIFLPQPPECWDYRYVPPYLNMGLLCIAESYQWGEMSVTEALAISRTFPSSFNPETTQSESPSPDFNPIT
jgi:hypothetical protein